MVQAYIMPTQNPVTYKRRLRGENRYACSFCLGRICPCRLPQTGLIPMPSRGAVVAGFRHMGDVLGQVLLAAVAAIEWRVK
jgi:hypothetical protein